MNLNPLILGNVSVVAVTVIGIFILSIVFPSLINSTVALCSPRESLLSAARMKKKLILPFSNGKLGMNIRLRPTPSRVKYPCECSSPPAHAANALIFILETIARAIPEMQGFQHSVIVES